MKTAILGAGICGLELGRNLKKQKKDFIILEKNNRPGGLCRTNKTGPYYWDFGVHALYSRNQNIMDYYNSIPVDYEKKDRNVKIVHYRNNRAYIIDYPFEIGIKDLPFKEKFECIAGYLLARIKKKKDKQNLEQWIKNQLGSGIMKHFMVPYNNKIWNCRLSEISDTLVSIRIHPLPFFNFLASIFGKKAVGRKYQAKFIYPKKGIQEFINYTARTIKNNIYLNSAVEKIIHRNNKWQIITDKQVIKNIDKIISTIPLVELLKKVNIKGLNKEYSTFKWNNTYFVLIGLKDGRSFNLINDCQWVFFKEYEIFYRVTLMHNFSSQFPPAIVAEITQKNNSQNAVPEHLIENVINDLINLKIIKSRDDIARTDIKLEKHTYPIPTVGLEPVKKNIKEILKKNNIHIIGRNGNWDYINVDEVILKVQDYFSIKL